MHGLLVETTLGLLAQPTLYYCSIFLHNYYSTDVWLNILGPWHQNVSDKKVKLFQIQLNFFLDFKSLISFQLVKCRKKQQDLLNAMGSMYAAVVFLGVQNAASVQPVVAVERTVFYRERAAGMYSAFPYAFSQVINFRANFNTFYVIHKYVIFLSDGYLVISCLL